MTITGKEKEILLFEARNAIRNIFAGQEIKVYPEDEYPGLYTECGVFVTLKKKKKLRGCIGYLESEKFLIDTLRDAAVQAALNDPRFPSVDEKELKDIHIEVSVLSVPEPVTDYSEIEIGKHGLILEENRMRGLLLPQVPVEHKMNVEQYLDAICSKTGVPEKLHQVKKLNLLKFTAEVFEE